VIADCIIYVLVFSIVATLAFVRSNVSRQSVLISKRAFAAWISTNIWFFTYVRSTVFRQMVFLCTLAFVRSNVSRQMTIICKRLSASWLSTREWFFTRVHSKMDNQ
jgi:hypothetical protein